MGKSVIFTFLTGRYAVASNYPGTTVEVSFGQATFNRSIEVIDTPGVNSLFPRSEDEKVTRDILLRSDRATVVQVADAKNLFRALLLTTQLAELGCPMVLVLNMMDEARQRGITINVKALSERLGIEVIPTVAVEKRGLTRLVSAIASRNAKVPRIRVEYPKPLLDAVRSVEDVLGGPSESETFGILSLLAGDGEVLGMRIGDMGDRIDELAQLLESRERRLPNRYPYYIASGRKALVEDIMRRTSHRSEDPFLRRRGDIRRYLPTIVLGAIIVLLYLVAGLEPLEGIGLHPTLLVLIAMVFGVTVTGIERTNRITLHPVYGAFILIVVLYLIYMLVGVFAAGTIVDVIESNLFGKLIIPALDRLLPPGMFRDFLTGEFGLVSVGLNYSISIVLPIVTVFFIVFGVLEDTGYFPRLTVLTNRFFRMVGVSGKATLPIVLGFGCVTMATLASRILETRKERIIVVTLLALAVPCSAQLGVILALLSAISIPAVLLIGLVVLIEFVLAGIVLSRLLKGAASDFIIELPPLRTPRPGNIWLKTAARVRWFLREALPFFLLATALLFVLDASGGMSIVHRAVEPVVGRVLGLPLETAAVFIVGFFRRDYGAAGLYKLWENGLLAGNQVVVALVVMSLFLPCLATLIVMIKELGARYAFTILLFVMLVSVLTGGLLNLILRVTGVQL
ncbi:MAG: ferrous iron transport protein B [bacterium]|nr:MAG: ferrous iron transport protein B [bacterium]